MASDEHKRLANYLKEVHSSLRKSTKEIGADEAWKEHCRNTNTLQTYAQYMEKLATTYWDENFSNDTSLATSRIEWVAKVCHDYIIDQQYLQYRGKEGKICKMIDVKMKSEESFSLPIKLLDVGSCFNPFKSYDFIDVLAVDLCPANNSVHMCDFLNIDIKSSTELGNGTVQSLESHSFDVVTFCYLLEYIPTSDLRVRACENAYKVLKPGGLLIISTPDSKHVGANCRIMKCWRYTLACMGFTRIKYEKFKHMHCMAFRKAICRESSIRWATIHRQPYMEYCINIPQDFTNEVDKNPNPVEIKFSVDDFKDLPFCELDDECDS